MCVGVGGWCVGVGGWWMRKVLCVWVVGGVCGCRWVVDEEGIVCRWVVWV